MNKATRKVAKYVKDKEVNIAEMARATEINYNRLYENLGRKGRRRNLKQEELEKVCSYLGEDVKRFM